MPNYKTPESLEYVLSQRRGYQAAEDARHLGMVPHNLFSGRCLTGEGQAYVAALQTTQTALQEGQMWPPVQEELSNEVVSAIGVALSAMDDSNRGNAPAIVIETNRALGDLIQFDVLERSRMLGEASRSAVLGA